MNKLIIGCDPDSKASGFAFYVNGCLVRCENLTLSDLFIELGSLLNQDFDIELHIEDVKAKKAVWHNRKGSQAAYGMTCQKVGQCKQVQTEVERIAEHFGIEIVRHPVSSKWKSQKEKAEFQQITGWTERSNEDTRSACWFGYQAVLKQNKRDTIS